MLEEKNPYNKRMYVRVLQAQLRKQLEYLNKMEEFNDKEIAELATEIRDLKAKENS